VRHLFMVRNSPNVIVGAELCWTLKQSGAV
jgi:hypothetical protein